MKLRPVALMSSDSPCYSPPTSNKASKHLESMTFLEFTLSAPRWETQA